MCSCLIRLAVVSFLIHIATEIEGCRAIFLSALFDSYDAFSCCSMLYM
jgi:hypothetical protein